MKVVDRILYFIGKQEISYRGTRETPGNIDTW